MIGRSFLHEHSIAAHAAAVFKRERVGNDAHFSAKFRPLGLPGPAASWWWNLVPI